MTKEEFDILLLQGVNESIEFKKAADTLPVTLWESYYAFANTDGGTIILGVSERGW